MNEELSLKAAIQDCDQYFVNNFPDLVDAFFELAFQEHTLTDACIPNDYQERVASGVEVLESQELVRKEDLGDVFNIAQIMVGTKLDSIRTAFNGATTQVGAKNGEQRRELREHIEFLAQLLASYIMDELIEGN